jgi:BASS family bile acid:Na+ symporter
MTLEEMPGLALKASILMIVFQLGTKTKSQDIFFLSRQPSLLLRSLLSMSIIIPACAVALALAFDLNAAVKWALVALALSPVPPFLPINQIKAGGCAPYAISLLVVEALAAIVFIPAAVIVCRFIFHNDAHVEISTVTLTILVTVLAPLVFGMLASRFAATFAQRIGDPVGRVGSSLLLVAMAGILLNNARGIVSLFGDGTVVAIVAFNVLGTAIGHLLGGPKPAERAVLALASAARHPGVAAAMLAANSPDYKSALAAVVLYVVIGMIVRTAYLRWMKRQLAERMGLA